MDIAVILLLSIAAIPVVAVTDGPLRIALGVIVLLIFPGYTLAAALFPTRRSLGSVERAGLTLVLSFAEISLVGLLLNYTPWGIRLAPITIATLAVIFIQSGIAILRRMRVPETERFVPRIHFESTTWSTAGRFDKALYVALVLAVVASATTLVYVIARPKPIQPFTNFYVLGPGGKMVDYPSRVALNGSAVVTVGITNHENRAASYTVDVTFDGKIIRNIGPVGLLDDGDWSIPVTLTPSRVGDNQQIEFLLRKNQDSDVYLTLRLWLDVTN